MSNKTAHVEPWWKQALVEFSIQGRRLLRRKFPSIQRVHDDLISEAILDLTTLIRARPTTLPESWFGSATPDRVSVDRFHRLAHTILERRVVDYFRRHFMRWAESLDDLPQDLEPASPGRAADVGLDLKRTVKALLSVIATLPRADRELLQRVALGEVLAPMGDKERQRLHRLRVALLTKLRAWLGEDPIALLRML